MVRRRAFITLLGGAVAWPLVAHAQRPAMPVIGFLNGGSPAAFAELAASFRRGLQENGYVEDQNVLIEYRWAEGHHDRLPALAADLVDRRVAVIASTGGPDVVEAAAAATTTVPIVFLGSDSVLKTGVITSLNRPTGNVTGMVMSVTALLSKCLQFLDELVMKDRAIAVLLNPGSSTTPDDQEQIQAAARRIGRRIFIVTAANEAEIDGVFATLAERHAGGLVVQGDILFTNRRDDMVARGASGHSGDLCLERVHGGRRADRLWQQPRGGIQAGWQLHWANSSRCKTGRPAGHAAEPLQVHHQSQNREEPGSDDTGVAADPGRRGH